MANRQTVMIDGQRVDITNKDMTWEFTCDGCGEYCAAGGLVTLQGQMSWEGANPSAYTVDVHVKCLHKLPELLAARAADQPPF